MGIEKADLEKHKKLKSQKNSRDKIIVLTVGRWEPSRRLEVILKAFKKVISHHTDVELWIVGAEATRSTFTNPGYLEHIKQLARDLGLLKNIRFKGELRGEELQKSYAFADIFVYASLYENFGQSILEAASFGLPVISTPVGIAPEIVINEETGFLYNFDDHDDLARKINILIKDDGLRKNYSKNIISIVEERFTFDKIVSMYKTLYETLI